MNQNIDFDTIWNKIHGDLTEEEELLLQRWLQEDDSHQKFYNDVIRYYEQGSQFANSPDELKKALRKIYRKAGIVTPNHYARVITITSLAASILLFVYFRLFQPGTTDQIVKVEEVVQSIVPGSNKAMLILSDGSQHDLSAEKSSVITADGSKIKNTGNKLEYISSVNQSIENKYNTLIVPRGGEYFLVLSDCTKVWLNSETTLKYPVHFTGDTRQVELSGEAYFEVSKKNGIPFLVTSGNQQVKVLGTQFDVSSYPENSAIYTTLVEGSVEVSVGNKTDETIRLKPSEQSFLVKSENQIGKKVVDVSQYVAWKDGRFVFRDETLGEIMSTLSKWYNIQVVFAHEEQKKLRFTGNLQRHVDFNDILGKIEKTNEVKFEIANNLITIK